MENLTASFSANCRPVQAIRRPQCAAFRAVVCLTCILVGAKAAPAATYYVDAVNGDDSNPGTSAQPWKTLNRAYTWYSGDGPKVQEGDTVYFRDGNYGEFRESTRYNPGEKWLLYRNDWVTYKADVGHSPTLSKIEINNQDKWGDIVHGRSYLIFDGFAVSEGVSLQYTSYVQVRNCNIAGEASPYSELSTGFYAPYVYGSGIGVRYSHYITLESNEISYVYRGIGVAGNTDNIVIRNNNIHYIGEDGMVVGEATNATVEDNTVYDLHPYRAVVDIRGTKTGDFTVGEEVILVGKTARGIFHRWTGSYASVYQTTEASFKDEYAAGDTLKGTTSGTTLNITYVDPQHTDGITLMGSEDVILRGNTVIRRRLGGANGQGLKVDRGINITIENNILDASAHLIMIDFPGMPLEIANMNNNTFYGTPGSDGRVRIYLGTGANRDITINNMYNNIIHRLVLSGDVGDNYTRIANHGNNIFGNNPDGAGGLKYPFKVDYKSELVNYDLDSLFVDTDSDFRVIMSSPACDGSVNGKAGVAVGALPCVCRDDSDCIFGGKCVNWECVGEKNCFETDSSCGSFPDCVNCNFLDGCYGNDYREYSCTSNAAGCEYSSTDCTTCSCTCGGFGEIESTEKNNCLDSKDNDCDANTDGSDYGCQGVSGIPLDYAAYFRFEGTINDYTENNSVAWVGENGENYEKRLDDNYAKIFNGNDYIRLPNNENFNLFTNFTISVWGKPEKTGTGAIICKGHLSSSEYGQYVLYSMGSGDKVRYYFRITNLTYYNLLASEPIYDLNEWVHVVGRFDGEKASLFVNGVKVDEEATLFSELHQSPGSYNKIEIGKDANSRYYFNGSLDEIIVYRRALNQTEIRQIYCSQGGDC